MIAANSCRDCHPTKVMLADSSQHIIAGHDPLLMELFPAWTPQSESMVIRLGVEPLGSVPHYTGLALMEIEGISSQLF